MSSRRLAISSLLCDDEPAPIVSPAQPEPQIIAETVVLAPHLRNSTLTAVQRSPESRDHLELAFNNGQRSSSAGKRPVSDYGSYSPAQRSLPIEAHYQTTSGSSSPRAPVAYHPSAALSPHQSFPSPGMHSPGSVLSPLLNRPTPSHLSMPVRRPSSSHSHSTASPQLAQPTSGSKFGLEALVHVAFEERRRLSNPEVEPIPSPGPFDEFRNNNEWQSQPRQFPSRPSSGLRAATLSPIQDLKLGTPVLSPHPQQRREEIYEEELAYRRATFPGLPSTSRAPDHIENHKQRLIQYQRQQEMLAAQSEEHFPRPALSHSSPQGSSLSYQFRSPPQHALLDVQEHQERRGGRKSDPGRTSTFEPTPRHFPTPAGLVDPRTSKKRRYSDAPPSPPMKRLEDPDSDRIHRDRQRMQFGELGFGRSIAMTGPGQHHPGRLGPMVNEGPGRTIVSRKPEFEDRESLAVKAELREIVLTGPGVPPAPSKPSHFMATVMEQPNRQKHDDAHDWFLEQYSGSSPSTKDTKDHSSGRDFKGAESPQAFTKPEPSLGEPMDVDAAREKPVVQTLESEPVGTGMEVDVEDELLSLVDATRPPSDLVSTSTNRQTMPHSPATSAIPAIVRASSTQPTTSERGSMPPPQSTEVSKAAGKEKKKPGPKPKKAAPAVAPPPKPRAKPGPKPKPRNPDGTIVKNVPPAAPPKPTKASAGAVRKTVATSRSRSTSVMPGGSVGPEETKTDKREEDESDSANDADKLYCVCKTKYDEEKVMIACDRCDEWYHTQCVNMPESEVDLVDQFICPVCVAKNPELALNTTYKQRCLYGLEHPDPSSFKACNKPARGAFSKYCSDECGLQNLSRRIGNFTMKGGKRDLLWEAVKHAEKQEGVVLHIEQQSGAAPKLVPVKPLRTKLDREVERLERLLEGVVRVREDLKKGMEVIVWREKLLELAIRRAESKGLCGWDMRLCYGDAEYTEFGDSALDSYVENQDTMDADADCWCSEQSQCERHEGWQGVRRKDVLKEKELKADALHNITTKERAIRKNIMDNSRVEPAPVLKPDKQVNGHGKGKVNGGDAKKGKKRKTLPG